MRVVAAVAQVAARKIRVRVLARQFRHGANEAVVAAKRIERIGVCRGMNALRCACE